MIIVISNPAPVKDEHKLICQLFDEGLEIFHLRKKELSEIETRKFIESIPAEYFGRIVLHSQYQLAKEYGLKGIHISPSFNGDASFKSLSISFHSLEEINRFKLQFDYAFLSPVFESISKQGYGGNLNLCEIKQFLNSKKARIIALGGIDEDKIETVKELGFSGIALLGAIWQNENPVEKYLRIKEKWLKQMLAY